MIINPAPAAPVADVPLSIPATLQIAMTPTNNGGVRIETQWAADGMSLEVAYWYPNGFNDIMRGKRGTLNETINALVVFTIGGAE